ncbi:MAG: MerC family mercury resistance protein [Acidobacteriaceae bacterium]
MRIDRWTTVPGIGVALLPKLVCPLCWPAYAALLSALGLGFLVQARYLFAFTAAFLLLALAALSFRAQRRRGYRPALLGLAGSAFILGGKFIIGSHLALYTGVAMLIVAAVWNAWPQPKNSCCT